jgi:hypothetical protein
MKLRADREEERKTEAKQRTEERATRSPQEQLKRLDEYGYRAVKERARLQALINPPAKKK